MKKYLTFLTGTQLFFGAKEEDIEAMLSCLGLRHKAYKKGEYVFCHGEHLKDMAVLVEGSLHIQKDDYWGNRSILGQISPGEMFGEAYVAPQSDAFWGDVIAVEDSVVFFFTMKRLISACPSACPFHTRVVENMFYAISEKNRKLVQKLAHMSMRTTREKLISYLSEEARKQNSATFEIPFNRQQLADYLSVDRSAMSNELCKMRNEGKLLFHKHKFTLLS